MAVVGVLGYAAFHHVEHGLTDGSIHHLHHTSHRAACSHKRKAKKTTPFGVGLVRSQVMYWAAHSSCLLTPVLSLLL